jgi:hypothetical protein
MIRDQGRSLGALRVDIRAVLAGIRALPASKYKTACSAADGSVSILAS